MSDKKVNLQALFDEQSKRRPNSSYTPNQSHRDIRREQARERQLRAGPDTRLTHLGKKHSDESRAKMSAIHKGRKHSDEHKQNQSIGAKQRWQENPYTPTEEVGKKRSEGLKKYWAERKANMPPKPPKSIEPPKKRGRPRTRPLPDLNQAPKRRGRPPKVL